MLADGLTEARAVEWYGDCLGELYTAVLERAIDRCRPAGEGGLAGTPHCWLHFGAAGRGEVMMPVPEIDVLYADAPAGLEATFQKSGAHWAQRVLDLLAAAGFRPAAEPTFELPLCLPLRAWKRFFERLSSDPSVRAFTPVEAGST